MTSVIRELNEDDFKNHNLPDDCTRFDVLLAVVERASSLYDESKKKEKDEAFCNSSFLMKRKVCSAAEKKDEAFCFPRTPAKQDCKVQLRPIQKRSLAQSIAETDDENSDQEGVIIIKKKKKRKQQGPNNLFNYVSPLEILLPHDQLLPNEFKESLASFNQGLIIEKETLVIQKALTATDISPHQNRFSIPSNHILNSFLNEDENKILESREENGKNVKKLDVNMIDPMRTKWEVSLRRWVMNKKVSQSQSQSQSLSLAHGDNNSAKRKCSGGGGGGGGGGAASVSYVINGPWSQVVDSNKLKQGDIMQLWSVRVGVHGSLWFVLLKLPTT